MSMPDISLEEIDPRIALASIVASIALQEAAVSHVLNAEGEKIQAVVGMTGTTVEDLQNINLSVGDLVDNVALFEDDLQEKLRTALHALFPAATFAIHFIDSITLAPVDCQCVLCTLTNDTTGDTSTFYAQGDTLTLASLKPGSYTLHMLEACAGYAPNENEFDIDVDARGNVTFNGASVTDESPAVVELTEEPFGAAAQATVQGPGAAPDVPAQEAAPEPDAEPEPAQASGYQVMRFNPATGQFETPEAY